MIYRAIARAERPRLHVNTRAYICMLVIRPKYLRYFQAPESSGWVYSSL